MPGVLSTLNSSSVAANMALKKSQYQQNQHAQNRRAAAQSKLRAAKAAVRANPAANADHQQQPHSLAGDLGILGGRCAENNPDIPSVAGHVAQSAACRAAAEHHASTKAHHPRRQPLASWPPSPEGLPPTPRFGVVADEVAPMTRQARKAPSKRSAPPAAAIVEEVPAVVLTSPINEEAMSIVPSPSQLLKAVNEQARINAATYLSDWTSDVVWELCYPVISEMDHTTSVRRSSFSSLTAPPAFRRFVQQTVYQVSASPASLTLALWYIQRLPLKLLTDEGRKSYGRVTEAEHAFAKDLLSNPSEIPWRLLILGMTLSNKWLEDNTFTTKTWNEVTGLPSSSMRSLEATALAIFSWVMGPQPTQWLEWLHHLRRRELAARSSIAVGAERTTAHKRPIQVLDDLISEINIEDSLMLDATLPTTVSSSFSPVTPPRQSPTTVFASVIDEEEEERLAMGMVANTRDRALSWSEQSMPLRSRINTSSPIQSLFAVEEDRSVYGIKRLKTPAVWDPRSADLDSPVTAPVRRLRPTYEAIRRPMAQQQLEMMYPSPPMEAYDQKVYGGDHQHAGIPHTYEYTSHPAQYEAQQPVYYDPHFSYGYSRLSPPVSAERQEQYGAQVPVSYGQHPQANAERSWYDASAAMLMSRGMLDGYVSGSGHGVGPWAGLAGSLRTF